MIPGFPPYHVEDAGIIYCADCRDILPHLPKVDLVLTDPPYGINYKYDKYEDNPDEYENFIKSIINNCSELIKDNCACFFWQAMLNADKWHRWFPIPFRIFAGLRNFSQFLPTSIQFSWDPIIFWFKGKPHSNGIAGNRDYHIGNTSKYVAQKNYGHPCPRPICTVSYIITITSEINNIILDPFLGSGTTAVAAKELGRKFIGIEISEKYCEIAVKRLRQGVLNFG